MAQSLNTVTEMLQRVERNLEKVGNYHEISRSSGREEISRSSLEERLAALEKRLDGVEKENDQKMRGLAEAVRSKLLEISRSVDKEISRS